MKTLLLTLLFTLSVLAEYQTGKIDMHGGKNYSDYKSPGKSFGSARMGMSAFLDANASKKD